jgi:branched-chain amino acid transport system permease protein
VLAAITGKDVLTFLITGLTVGAIYSLSALGLVVVHRATGVVNFAQGAIGAITALVYSQEFVTAHRSIWVGWPVCLVLAVVLSLAYGRVLAPRLAHRDAVVKAIGTLGFALFILGFCGWKWSSHKVRGLDLPTDTTKFQMFGVTVTLTKVFVLLLAICVTIAISLYLTKTRMGLNMRALANDRELSSMIGVDVLRAETVAWIIAGLLAGQSGILFANVVRLDAISLTFLVIPAIAAAVVGQLRSLLWTLVGGLVIGVVEAELTNFDALKQYKSVAEFLVGAGVLLFIQRKSVISFTAADA